MSFPASRRHRGRDRPQRRRQNHPVQDDHRPGAAGQRHDPLGETVKLAYVDQSRDVLDPKRASGRRLPAGGHRSNWATARSTPGPTWPGSIFPADQQKKVGHAFRRPAQPGAPGQDAAKGANVLLLDEPTNDLDVNTLRAWKRPWRISAAAPWSSATTAGFWTASPPIFWPSKATARIAGVGIVVLFWAVIKVLSHIENSFNHIWGVPSRSFVRKLSDYLTIMLICPVLMIMSSSVTVFISHQVSVMSGQFELVELVGPVLYTGLKLLPYVLIWLLFTLVYIIMPNTQVPFSGALLAGIIAGSAYQVIQAVYIFFQLNVSSYNAIYGSFAALPLFLIWLQISWNIVIIGAEVSHAYRNSAFVDQTDGGRQMSIYQTRFLALAICRHVVHIFHMGRPAQTTKQIAKKLSLSPVLVDNLSALLVKGKILVKINSSETDENALQPAVDIGSLTVNTVITALEDVGANGQPLFAMSSVGHALSQTLAAFRKQIDRSDANKLLIEL
jgi:membrane protein